MNANGQYPLPKSEGQSTFDAITTEFPVNVSPGFVDLTFSSSSSSSSFPTPKDTTFIPLFQYIQDKLWPLWTEQEKEHFKHTIAPQVQLSRRLPTRKMFLSRPSSVGFVKNARDLVDVVVSFAIWGPEPLRLRANFCAITRLHKTRLAQFPNGPVPEFGQPAHAARMARGRLLKRTNKADDTASQARKIAKRSWTSGSDEATLVGQVSTPSTESDCSTDLAVRPQRQNRQQINYAEIPPLSDLEVESDTSPAADEPVGRESVQHQPVASNTNVSEDLARNLQGVLAEKEALEKNQADLRSQVADIAKLFYSEAHMTILAFEGIKHDGTDVEQVKCVKKISDNLKSMFNRAQQWIDRGSG